MAGKPLLPGEVSHERLLHVAPLEAVAAPPVVELFVTHGQQVQIGYGTDEFVAAMLADLGV